MTFLAGAFAAVFFGTDFEAAAFLGAADFFSVAFFTDACRFAAGVLAAAFSAVLRVAGAFLVDDFAAFFTEAGAFFAGAFLAAAFLVGLMERAFP